MASAGKRPLWTVWLLGGACSLACAGSASDAPDAESAEAAAPEPKKKRRRHDDVPEDERAMRPVKDDAPGAGWRWKGERGDCFYVFDNECFETRKAACRAAGCGERGCDDAGTSAPTKVACRKE